MRASALYRADLWRAGLIAARLLPRAALEGIASRLALAYCLGNRKRRHLVTENLLPPLDFDRRQAAIVCRKLYAQFGRKLADLWRYEAGCKLDPLSISANQWDRFESARSRGKGLLLLTPHLGNWEFGAPFLRERGVTMQVITQAEPQASLTHLRQNSRARWGIETIVIGENPFTFVEVIRRLEAGATVALLVDRPPASSAVTVKLFGHRFAASIAPAELARASGCALLPVSILRGAKNYAVEVSPEIHYERVSLGSREARANLTQEIMKQFEPVIRDHLDQWFHFVPLWQSPQPQ